MELIRVTKISFLKPIQTIPKQNNFSHAKKMNNQSQIISKTKRDLVLIFRMRILNSIKYIICPVSKLK
jgi:hypothetical protein